MQIHGGTMESRLVTSVEIRNAKLNELKAIFDLIEPYAVTDNIGFRSLKNIGVWLIVYGLTNNAQKPHVVQALLSKAGVQDAGATQATIDFLAQPENLQAIIRDYEMANGQFKITVKSNENLVALRAAAAEHGYADVVKDYLAVNEKQDAVFVFDMSNTVKFQWANNQVNPIELCNNNDIEFKGVGKTEYLSTRRTDAEPAYNLIKYRNRHYHVARLVTLQVNKTGETESTAVYVVEPVDAADHVMLQQDYLAIIQSFKFDKTPKTYADLIFLGMSRPLDSNAITYSATMEPYGMITNIKRFDPHAMGHKTKYHVSVQLPQIAQTLKTKEERLGAYAVFMHKDIGSVSAESIFYLGERELYYDKTGGEIKNVERFGGEESCSFGDYHEAMIDIRYTVMGPFSLVYEAVNKSDYYAFKIVNPIKDLEKSFASDASYTDVKEKTVEVSAAQAGRHNMGFHASPESVRRGTVVDNELSNSFRKA
jgi:hypothetical protein